MSPTKASTSKPGQDGEHVERLDGRHGHHSHHSHQRHRLHLAKVCDARHLPVPLELRRLNRSTAKYSSAVTVTVTKAQTKATITATDTTPACNQQVTFTAKLYWWNPTTHTWVALGGKPVTIWHTYKGARYNDVTKKTVAGKITLTQKFGSTGVHYYHITFAGDTLYRGRRAS